MVGNAVLFDERDEISGRVTRERGFCEVRIRRNKIFRAAMEIGEVAAAPAGDEYLFAGALGSFEDGNAASAFTSFNGAHKAGGPGAENQYVKIMCRQEFARCNGKT